MTATVEGFALSPQQERLWQVQEGGVEGLYGAFCSLRIAEDIDPERLRQALGLVVERHEILRTAFQRIPGLSTPLQVIGSPAPPALDRHDLTGCPESECEERIDALLREMARLADGPPGSAGGPPLRATLVELPDGPRLLLALPALCADAAGMESLAREVESAYGDLARGPRGALAAEETLQYVDLSAWLNDLLESQDPRSRKYWQSRDVQSLLEVRLPFARAARAAFAPRRLTVPIHPDLSRRIAGLARSLAVPVSAVLLAAWTVLLQRLAGRPVAVATVFDGRRGGELRDAIGLLARHLPVQVAVEEPTPFEEVVRRTAKAVDELSPWQDFFDWKAVVGGNGAPHFFPFAFESREDPRPGGASFALERCGARFDRFELKLWCRRDGERLAIDLEHDAATVVPEDAARVGAWFREQLEAAVVRPVAAALDLEILPAEERSRLAALRGDRRDFGPALTLAECFGEQVRRTPDRTALACGDVEISFAELGARATRLARLLRRLGVGPDAKVALAAERSVEMIVGLLGILQAGGAYVPVDLAQPESRRDLLVEDAGVTLLLTQEHLLDRFAGTAPRVVCLGREELEAAGESPEAPMADAGPDHLAYVIYTSGSTGRPKGVGISHRGIANRLLWMQHAFPLAAEDRVLLKTPYGFDASVWEIFLPLMTGARLVVAAPEAHRDPALLLKEIERHGVTVLQLVPSLLAAFLEQPDAGERCRTLRRLFCGGEAFPSLLAARAAAELDVEVCNLYGPTEVAIDATFRPWSPGREEAIVPIGRPLDNVDLLLLDRSGRPVPPGIAGEIHVGGPGLARGYLGRPDLTARSFVPHTGAGQPGQRLYRTGDLGLLAVDGEVHFLGRIDHQVKVRGVRIELGEVEAALLRHPAVREAVAMVREDGAAGPRLVAYAVLRPGHPSQDVAGLREALAGELPEPMVPAAIVEVGELPRLSNGKLDRAALPAPEQVRGAAVSSHVAPRTPAEEILAGIWSETLGVERVGVHDGFFDLGGHSLIATRMIARVREAFRVELSVRKLFEAPTVAGLAGEVESALRSAEGIEVPAIGRAPRGGDLPLSFPQQRLWFLQQLEPASPAYNIPGALRLQGDLDRMALARAIAALVDRHEALRTVFHVAQGEPVQRIRPAAGWEIPVLDLSGLPDGVRQEAVLAVSAAEALRPFDLSTDPLLRTLLLRLSAAGEHVLFFNLHHIVSDGWSVALLVRELSALYAGGRSGEDPRLPDLAVQYADYACWQRGWLQGEALERQLDYWRQRLAGAPEVLNLPIDRPHPATQTYRGGARSHSFPVDLCAALSALSRQCSVTLFTTLLAAFKVLLLRYGAGEDLVVGTNAANRTRKEVEGLIGFFVNALVLRTGLAGDPSFREALARVRETVLGAFAHQDLPFDRIVEELQPRRDLSVTPLFQVVFDMDPASRVEPLELADLEITPVPLSRRTAKFDLNLTLGERGEGLEVVAEYSADILDAATVDRLLGHFENLLRSLVAGPEERIGALALLGEAETFQLLHELQGPERPGYPLEETVQSLFVRQVARTPDEIAAVCGGERLPYAELDRRSEGLARALRRVGVRPGCFVGLLDERGLDYLVALLAILKAGGAYVPFEPAYPEDRLLYMLTSSGIVVLVARARLIAGRFEVLAACPELRAVVCLGDAAERLAVAPGLHVERFDPCDSGAPGETARALPGHARDPAYMLYTSGSTGFPKGAVVRHDGAVNHIWAQSEALELDSSLCFLQSAPASSDISVWQFLAPLLLGGRTVIVDPETVSDPRRLLRVLRAERVTLAELVPAVLRGLIDHAAALSEKERALPELRWMMATGEAVPVDLVNDWLALYPRTPVVNAYGPTEAADDVTQAVFDRPLPPGVHALSIGRPLANFSCHVVDRGLGLVPFGAPGELCIGGIGVGGGYWRAPERTGLSFVPDPFAPAPGAVLYRTGDLVRWRGGGELEFLGRIDHQVKIRGFRIELGEIEAALREHPAIQDAVAVARGDGEKRLLVAYVAVGEEAGLDPAELRSTLQARLPSHMVPAAYVLLPSLPRSLNGKVDRRALPAPDRSGPEGPFEPPHTPAEQKLAEIWSEVFRIEAVGRGTDFFEIGGHSLLAVRVLSRIQAAFEVEIPLRQIFESSTLAGLAAVIEAAGQEAARARRPAIRKAAREGRVVTGSEGIIKALS
jgi:amino acid adenylation domain-containing protein